MAKVSLRIYNRDIENLVDQGHLDEAIAHCRHILKTFPKHLETYRLLGKAYLESKRYDEAVDILQRVLVSVPDDFVSHVGMSIIRDDQGKLDDAIWHMERAFESQPSNAAIQGELRRLYGRRDGVEPPKIRMTRGALAHMYVQGELYPQAISEIKAVLGGDPERVDMKVLLALAYFRSGQKADASDICNQLLNRPGGEYGFEANRIMIELLHGSDAGDTQVHRQRVIQMDPYAAFAQPSVFQAAAVSDGAVTVERLEYRGQPVELDSNWSSSGIDLTSPPRQPDWLTAAASAADSESGPVPPAPLQEEALRGTMSAGEEPLPDFLRQAGWGESTGAAQETPSPFEIEQTPPVSETDLAPGEMPDWLKAMSPAEPEPGAAPKPSAPDSFEDTPVWPRGLDELSAPSLGEAPTAEDDTPPWLSGLSEITESSTPADTSLPDWLTSEKQTEEPAPSSPAASASLDTLGASAQEQDDAVAWLESLAAKHGAKPEELVTDPEARSETPPDWVEQARAIAESQPAAATPAASEPEESHVAEDETGIWLRSLAAQETLDELGQAEGKDSTSEMGAPDWLKDLQPPSAVDESSEARPSSEMAASDEPVPAWLKGLQSAPARTEADDREFEPISGADFGETFKLDLNRASGQELSELPGIGPLLAQAIVAHRETYGDFTGVEDLKNIPGISAAMIEDLYPLIEVGAEQGIENDAVGAETDLPAWLRGLDEKPAEVVEPTTPADWRPVVEKSEPEPEAIQPPASKTQPVRKPAAEKTEPSAPAARSRPAAKPAPQADQALEAAQSELNRGDIPAALENYGRLIKKGRFTEEIIRDLREALYRYPVEVTVWQALGDAYMRANRLQEALDAYTKAEELLR